MVNKITIGLLVLLLFFVGGFGYYTYTFHQQANMMRVELNTFQNEQTAQTEAIHDELTALKGELQTGLDNLGAEIDKNIAHTVDLEGKVVANLAMLDTLEQKVSGNLEEIDGIRQALTTATEIAGDVMNAPSVYRKVSQAVVRINNGQRTVGSGFTYSPEGHVLTAHHVIDELDEIYVVFSDGKIFPALVVGSCAFSDVAVLKIDDISGIEPPTMADSNNIEIGDPVATIGSPFDLSESLNTGIISQVNRFADIEYDGQTRWVANLLQFDAAVNFGNSGGPLFNSDGDVIGLVIARVGPEEGDGIYYAISSNKVRRVVDSIITRGYFGYPWLGIDISDLTPQQAQDMGLESISGVLVNRIVAGSPAKAAGVQVNDVIVAIDSIEAGNVAKLTSYLGEYKSPEDPVTLTVIRDTATIDISLEIGPRE